MKKVLVIEDDSSIGILLDRLIRKLGYLPLLAANARQGFEMALQELPDLIFTDYFLPDYDAVQLVADIKNTPELLNIPIILITGSTHNIEPTLDNSVDELITKPFDIRTVMVLIHHFLTRLPLEEPGL